MSKTRVNIKRPNLTDYQHRFLYNDSRFTIITASTKVGKTFSCIWWLFEQAHKPSVKDGFNFWWVAPPYKQAEIAFKRMKRKVQRLKQYTVNKNELVIYCPNGAEIHFKTAADTDNLFGEDVHAAVFDECSRASSEAWYALRSTLTATQAPCKLIGNFGGSTNWVTQLAHKTKDDPNYSFYKITAYDAVDAGILPLDEVEQAKRDLPEKIFNQLYLAEGGDEEGQLIDNESIQKLYTNIIQGGIKYITGDIARLGKDKTVLFVWDGLKVIDILVLPTSTITDTVANIKFLKAKHNVNLSNIIVDEDGVGGGVVDILGCRGFVNNSSPVKMANQQQNFASLKDQCYYKLAEMINADEIGLTLPDEVKRLLNEELGQVRLPFEVDTNKIKLLSKKDIKKNIGRSPDYSDALMMRMYFLLRPNYGQYHISVV